MRRDRHAIHRQRGAAARQDPKFHQFAVAAQYEGQRDVRKRTCARKILTKHIFARDQRFAEIRRYFDAENRLIRSRRIQRFDAKARFINAGRRVGVLPVNEEPFILPVFRNMRDGLAA